jgi:hypothetical protein
MELEKIEPKETSTGSSGGFEAPLFSEIKKNNLFQPGTKTKHTKKPKIGIVETDALSGGVADGLTIEDLANQYGVSQREVIMQLDKGYKVEMEHTDTNIYAMQIAMDHIFEDLYYYDKLEKMETGGETTEATTASSSGQYDAPFGSGGKDPLRIDGPKSIMKSRAVKDKNWPKYGGKKGKYVKVKERCKRYPYCNQGDINALEMFEHKEIKEAINNISKKYDINHNEIISILEQKILNNHRTNR